MNNVQDGEAVSGIPAKPVKEHMRTLVLLRRLPQFNSDIKELKKRIETLEAQLEQAKVSV
jgi:UDP-3-O-[3-hydroxymyristoyl] glucosamine N-acyltransferase